MPFPQANIHIVYMRHLLGISLTRGYHKVKVETDLDILIIQCTVASSRIIALYSSLLYLHTGSHKDSSIPRRRINTEEISQRISDFYTNLVASTQEMHAQKMMKKHPKYTNLWTCIRFDLPLEGVGIECALYIELYVANYLIYVIYGLKSTSFMMYNKFLIIYPSSYYSVYGTLQRYIYYICMHIFQINDFLCLRLSFLVDATYIL